jgi:hypothetical protein
MYVEGISCMGRSQWPRGLRHELPCKIWGFHCGTDKNIVFWDITRATRRNIKEEDILYEFASFVQALWSLVRIPLQAWMFILLVLPSVNTGVAVGWSPAQGGLLTVYMIKKFVRQRPRFILDYTAHRLLLLLLLLLLPFLHPICPYII